jgi:hypothetical protein
MPSFNIPCSRAYCTSSALVLEAEVFHDRVFVKGHGARGHMEEVRAAAVIGMRTSTLVPLPACDSTESSPCHEPRALAHADEDKRAIGAHPLRIEADAVIGDGEPKLAALHC